MAPPSPDGDVSCASSFSCVSCDCVCNPHQNTCTSFGVFAPLHVHAPYELSLTFSAPLDTHQPHFG